MDVGNLYTLIPEVLPAERFDELIAEPGFCLERIVSKGHATPPGEWYDQDQAEWVVLLTGGAALRFDGQEDPIELQPGDYVLIPAHAKHRVEWTAPGTETVWLALHFRQQSM